MKVNHELDRSFTIGELAARTATTPRALRYYEAQGLLHPYRAPNGYREYPADALLQVRRIQALIRAGYSTQLIGDILRCAAERGEATVCAAIAERIGSMLERKEREAAELMAQARQIRAHLGRPSASADRVDRVRSAAPAQARGSQPS